MNTSKPTTRAHLRHKVIKLIRARLPFLESGKRYSLATIMGPDWDTHNAGEHVSLGRCFSGLVANGQLPFVPDGYTKRRHNAYQYIGP